MATQVFKMELRCPILDVAKYDDGHGRVAVQEWLSALNLVLICYEIHSFTSEWALEINHASRQNHDSYPLRPPLSEKKRAAHRITQATLMQAIQQGLASMPRITTIMQDFPLSSYGRAALAIGAEPYPVATMLLQRVIQEYAPEDINSAIEESDRLAAFLRTMPRFTCSDTKSFMTFLETLYSKYTCLAGAADAAEERKLMQKIKKALEMHDMSDNIAAPVIKFATLLNSWTTNPPATMRDLNNQLTDFCKDKQKLCREFTTTNSQQFVFKQPTPAPLTIAAPAIPEHTSRSPAPAPPCDVCDKTTHATKQCRKFQQMMKLWNNANLENGVGQRFSHAIRPFIQKNNRRFDRRPSYGPRSDNNPARNTSRNNQRQPSSTSYEPSRRVRSQTQDSSRHTSSRYTPRPADSTPFTGAATLENDVILAVPQLEFTGHVRPPS
jgi:hypothetical protein